MQKAPASRYASCAEMIDALRPLAAAAAPVRTRPTTSIPRVRPTAAPPETARPAAPAPPTADKGAPRRAPHGNGSLPPRAPSVVAARQQPTVPMRTVPPATIKAAPEQAPPSPPAAVEVAPPPADARPLGQRLGSFGVFLLALLAGAVAWLACSLILPK